MRIFAMTILFFACATTANAGGKAASSKSESNDKATSTKATADSTGYAAVSSTNIDFSETMIDGQMKAPAGFFLQGRQSQSLSQMVKLRSNFRRELQGSGAGMKSLIK